MLYHDSVCFSFKFHRTVRRKRDGIYVAPEKLLQMFSIFAYCWEVWSILLCLGFSGITVYLAFSKSFNENSHSFQNIPKQIPSYWWRNKEKNNSNTRYCLKMKWNLRSTEACSLHVVIIDYCYKCRQTQPRSHSAASGTSRCNINQFFKASWFGRVFLSFI